MLMIAWIVEPFYTATNDLEGDVHSSICYVPPIIGSLERHCANDVDECVAICALKTKCGQVIKEKFKRTMHHQVCKLMWCPIITFVANSLSKRVPIIGCL